MLRAQDPSSESALSQLSESEGEAVEGEVMAPESRKAAALLPVRTLHSALLRLTGCLLVSTMSVLD